MHFAYSFALIPVLMSACVAWAQAEAVVRVDGSSTVFPLAAAVAEEFQKTRRNATKVSVGISGTGGGFKKFCRGETDLSNASRPILKKEMEACKEAGVSFIELPIAYDALTVVINSRNTWARQMTVAELKAVWEPSAHGRVKSWKDINPAWPDEALKLYGPGADSGTFDYFTEAIVGKARASRGDYTASQDPNVLVHGVQNDKGALGYFGFSYYAEGQKKLHAVAVDAGKGAVQPSHEAVESGTYFPLSRPVFIYVALRSVSKPEVKEFVDFFLKRAPELVREVRYIPLSARVQALVLAKWVKRQHGSAFGGGELVGLKVEEQLKGDAKKHALPTT